jgi:hypothetical protein
MLNRLNEAETITQQNKTRAVYTNGEEMRNPLPAQKYEYTI